MTKPTSDRKIAANRINGSKGKGPKDTRSTRFNAVKHGLLAQGVTELDNAEGYLELLRDLKKERKPVGVVGIYLVESIAHGIVKSRRVRRLEAEFISEILNPPIYKTGLRVELAKELSATVSDPGLPASLSSGTVQTLFHLYQRYGTAIEKEIYRALHESERMQRHRQDQRVPSPATLEVPADNDNPSTAEMGDETALSGSAVQQDDPPAEEAETSTTVDYSLQGDSPGLPSFVEASTEEAGAVTSILDIDDSNRDPTQIVSPSVGEVPESFLAGSSSESEEVRKTANTVELEIAETIVEDR